MHGSQELHQGDYQKTTPSKADVTLAEICVKVIRRNMSMETDNDMQKAITNLPPHLQSFLAESYTCCSCSQFITRSNQLRELGGNWLPPVFERVHFLTPGVSLPTIPSTVGRPSTPLSTIAAGTDLTSTLSPALTLEEKVILALISRGILLSTYILGGSESDGIWEDHRYCVECVGRHLGLDGKEDGGCGCDTCAVEREVRGGHAGGVLRWLRRKGGR